MPVTTPARGTLQEADPRPLRAPAPRGHGSFEACLRLR